MSGITLKPLDDGQKAVEIPLGKTTIGRGPFLGCSDKKVSRNHAVLEVTAKREVFLTPTHVNPCFYQPTTDSPGQILKKDVPHKLENGDSFSLLPRAYRYQLIVQGDVTSSDQNNLSKPSEKTNGSTDAEDPHISSSKDALKAHNDNPSDSISQDETPSYIDKNHMKEKDCLSPQRDLDKTTIKEDSEVKNSTNSTDPKDENFTETKNSKEVSLNVESKDNCLNDNKNQEVPKEEHSDSFQDYTKLDSAKNTLSGKNISILGKEKGNVSAEVPLINELVSKEAHKGDFAENKIDADKAENSRQSLEDETLDTVASKDSINDADTEKVRPLDWVDESPIPVKPSGRKRGPSKGTKRKSASADALPKPRGRKKAAKFDFGLGDEGKLQRRAPERMSSRTNRQTRQGLSLEDFIVSDDDEWQSDTERSSPKRRRKRSSRRGDESGSDWETDHKKTKKTPQKGGSGSESGSDWGLHKKGKKGPKGKRKKGKQSTSDALSDEEEITNANTASAKKARIPCTFGKKCFRRNTNHLDQFSHPGDSDFASDSEKTKKNDAISESDEEAASPKKECLYGANCFRKNPQHKKDFKHTKKVRPQREAAKSADKKKNSSNDEIDSYDLDESLREDSADEYKPADSGSDYESGKKSKRLLTGKATGKTKRGRKV